MFKVLSHPITIDIQNTEVVLRPRVSLLSQLNEIRLETVLPRLQRLVIIQALQSRY